MGQACCSAVEEENVRVLERNDENERIPKVTKRKDPEFWMFKVPKLDIGRLLKNQEEDPPALPPAPVYRDDVRSYP
jgi:hypothetical protein